MKYANYSEYLPRVLLREFQPKNPKALRCEVEIIALIPQLVLPQLGLAQLGLAYMASIVPGSAYKSRANYFTARLRLRLKSR
jgi:hypothetical protein